MSNQRKTVLSTPEKPPPALNEDDDMDISEDEEGGTRIGGIYIPPPIKAHCSAESKGPRLVIRYIENTNFKSYANTVRVGPFHHRFSAVIGPNGSGKSNVIDSMLFVFGYRAQQIRSKKLSVLIHNSSKYSNVNSCKVAVHFQQIVDKEGGTFELLPNTEIIVARTAFKNNSSFYSINGREVKFKEVAMLLEEHNIDLLHNRFLILQGEVESIALMKPKALQPNESGLLEYLEDIIGTERYKKPLTLIYERLDKLNEERTEKHNRCRLAEREMKDLELPMTQAVDYLKLENQLYQAQNLHLQLYIKQQKKEIAISEEQKAEAVQVLKEHDDNFDEIKKQRLEKEKIVQDELKKHDELTSKLEECKQLEAKARECHQRVDAKLKSSNIRRKELKKQVEVDETKLSGLKNLPERNTKEIEESRVQTERLTKEKSELEAKLAENIKTLEKDTKPLQEQKEPLEKNLGVIKATLDKLKADYVEAEKELEIILKDETTEARKYDAIKTSFDDSKMQLDEKRKQLKEMQDVVPVMKQSVTQKQQEIKDLQQEEGVCSVDLRSVRVKLDENRTNMQVAASNNRVLNALMKEKQKGKLPGVLGRLGDLGGIDAKYDVAVSTCCGRLDNIVVEDVSTAQACIQYLKDNNIGRATFIALEKVSHYMRQAKQQKTYPQGVPRLIDLIQVEDERVLPAFYFGLHETLVANNMEQARQIAYGQPRYRVVTLNGDLIELTGTMSGGGRQQIRGKMGQKVQTKTANSRASMSERDMDALSQVAQNLQGRINDCQHKQGILDDEIRQLSANIRMKEQDIGRLQVHIKSLQEQLPRLEEQLKKRKEIAASTKSDPKKVKELEEKVEGAKKEYEIKEKEVSEIQSKINAFVGQIKEISDRKVKDVKVKIEKLSKQIEKLDTNINKLMVDIKTISRNVQKIEEKIENAKTDITETENSMRSMAAEREEYQKDSENLQIRIEDLAKEIEVAMKDSGSIKKEIAKFQKEEADGKIKRLELDEKLKTIEKELKGHEARIPAWEKTIKSLKLHEIPNQEMPDPPFKTFTDDELENKNTDDTQYTITIIEEQLKVNKPNLGAIEEFNKKRSVYLDRIKVLEDVTAKRNEMREAFDNVKKKRFTEFTEGFGIISRKLKEMYQMITLGGDAELELVDSMDPFTEGIVFSVRPPKKSWKVITNLSGGEKTLSSLALVFALHYYKPSPLYFMDEIDAALDFKNVSIVANYINERTKNAQFIIISLRSNMFELADYLVGIYKVDDCTQSLTIQNYDKDRVLGIGDNSEKENRDNYSFNNSISSPPVEKTAPSVHSQNGSIEMADLTPTKLPDLSSSVLTASPRSP